MGRRKTIDRNKVLEVAERLIEEQGPTSLTFDAVAKAAGITKGGVQSCFRSKEALIESLLARWTTRHTAQVVSMVGDNAEPLDVLEAHLRITFDEDEGTTARSAALLAALLQSPVYLETIRSWYRTHFGALLELNGTHAAEARLAFYAAEGLFFVRYLGLVQMQSAAWRSHLAEIRRCISNLVALTAAEVSLEENSR